MKRLDVNAAGIWEPKKGDVLCSRHFKKTDFDRSTPNTKLKPGVVPSVFESPDHLQVCFGTTARSECSLPVTVLKTLHHSWVCQHDFLQLKCILGVP